MRSWQKNLPMWMTYSRIVMVPLVLWGMVIDTPLSRVLAAALFIIASITDYFDGYYARKFNSVSVMGQLMDPIADKILVTSVLVMLVQSAKIDPFLVILILARDTLIGGLRQVAASQNMIIAAKPAGKWKTALQMVAIPILIYGSDWGQIPLMKIGFVVLWLSVILALTSGVEYVLAYSRAQKKP